MKIDEPEPSTDIPALWQLAFRPGFLGAAAFAVLSMAWWLAWLEGLLQWQPAFSPNWWHAHEMLLGFAMPVVVGFVLTAVATWTGIAGTRGKLLVALFACWAAARVFLLLPAPGSLQLAACFDTFFVLGAGYEVGRRVWASRQSRNYVFIPVFLLFAAINLLSYSRADQPAASASLHLALLLLFLFLIAFVGGRVIPFFTARRLQQEQPATLPWLDYGALGLLGSLVIAAMAGALDSAAAWLEIALWLCAALQLARLWRWQAPGIIGVPLLWSLHLSFLFLPLGLAALAWAIHDPAATRTVLHLLAIGCMAGMILAMIARVSLGHTGRPLEAGKLMQAAFVALALAALLRGLGPLLAPGITLWAWRLSALLWVMAFVIFLLRYSPILSTARPDGKPG